jgi:hypothetical protein
MSMRTPTAALVGLFLVAGGAHCGRGRILEPADSGLERDSAAPSPPPDASVDDGAEAQAIAPLLPDAGACVETSSGATADVGVSVLQFHNHASRDGVFTDPLLTKANAARMHLDPTFHASIKGNVYAQPLYVEAGPGTKGIFLVATENNSVYALDETGAQVWMKQVGPSASGPERCGNILPLGITGTPVVDLARRAIYFDAARPGATSGRLAEHEIHALSLDDGTELCGWPVKASSISAGGRTFNPKPENQRGALLIAQDTLYVPYGGHFGDCTDNAGNPYFGWVIGVPLDNPQGAIGWVSASSEAGIWAVGGLATDGVNLFAATGNGGTIEPCPSVPATSPPPGWLGQEAILRFQAGPAWSGQPTDYFAPLDWPCLDAVDLDIGGSNPVLFDVASGSPSQLLAAFGKDGMMYLADRTNLGGIGNDIASMPLVNGKIRTAPVAYATPSGTYVVANGSEGTGGGLGAACPSDQAGDLVAVKITPGTPPTMTTAWCADEMGAGSPIFTTSDGMNDALVWALGAEASQQLHAWDADTGAIVMNGGSSADVARGFHHFSTIIVVKGRIFAGADDALWAFAPQ